MSFLESVNKALPYIQKAWVSDKPPSTAQEAPVVHASEKTNTKKSRGFTDGGTIVKAQTLAVPASQAAASSGDVGAAAALAPPQMAGAK